MTLVIYNLNKINSTNSKEKPKFYKNEVLWEYILSLIQYLETDYCTETRQRESFCGNDFEFHEKMYEECFEKYKKILVLSKGIYQYHGHSFLIDQNLFYTGEDNTKATIEYDDSIKVYVNQNQIYEVKQETSINTILRYWMILLGECFNG